jgi:hypothetical protein
VGSNPAVPTNSRPTASNREDKSEDRIAEPPLALLAFFPIAAFASSALPPPLPQVAHLTAASEARSTPPPLSRIARIPPPLPHVNEHRVEVPARVSPSAS